MNKRNLEGITVEGVPLSTHLGLVENKKKGVRARKEHKLTGKIPLYKVPLKGRVESFEKNGPTTIFTREQVMAENLKKEIKKASTLSEQVIGVLMLKDTYRNCKDIGTKIQEITGNPPNTSSITGIASTCRKAFADNIQVQVPSTRKGGVKYKWIGDTMPLNEAYDKFKAFIRANKGKKQNTPEKPKLSPGKASTYDPNNEQQAQHEQSAEMSEIHIQETEETQGTNGIGSIDALLKECLDKGVGIRVSIEIDPTQNKA